MRTDGLLAVVPTAFADDGALDLTGTAALAAAYGEAGAVGLIVLGVMGEATALDDRERAAVVSAVRRAAAGLPVTVGLGAAGPNQVEAAGRAIDLGADALLAQLSADDDGRTTEEQLGMLAALGTPVIAQHHPAASGVRLSHAAVVEAVVGAGVAALKAESPPTPDLIAALVGAGGPPAVGGLSGLFLPEELEAGATGCATGVAIPELLVEVIDRHRGGDRSGARDRYLTATAYLRLEAAPGPSGLAVRKEAWRQRGVLASARLRVGQPLGPETKRAVTRRLRDVGVTVPVPYPDADATR